MYFRYPVLYITVYCRGTQLHLNKVPNYYLNSDYYSTIMHVAPEGAPPKVAFVTVGATATFKELIEEVFALPTLQTLVKEGYTKLRVQAGPEADYWKSNIPAEKGLGLEIEVFDFDRNGLGHEMRQCKKGGFYGNGESLEGIVISHAGQWNFE